MSRIRLAFCCLCIITGILSPGLCCMDGLQYGLPFSFLYPGHGDANMGWLIEDSTFLGIWYPAFKPVMLVLDIISWMTLFYFGTLTVLTSAQLPSWVQFSNPKLRYASRITAYVLIGSVCIGVLYWIAAAAVLIFDAWSFTSLIMILFIPTLGPIIPVISFGFLVFPRVRASFGSYTRRRGSTARFAPERGRESF